MHVSVCMCVYVCVCVYVCMSVCMYVCMCVCQWVGSQHVCFQAAEAACQLRELTTGRLTGRRTRRAPTALARRALGSSRTGTWCRQGHTLGRACPRAPRASSIKPSRWRRIAKTRWEAAEIDAVSASRAYVVPGIVDEDVLRLDQDGGAPHVQEDLNPPIAHAMRHADRVVHVEPVQAM